MKLGTTHETTAQVVSVILDTEPTGPGTEQYLKIKFLY